ncbi:hypothetical protein FSARC_12144 [Fusarium sarcochroum]|uniref:Uncharacterized protein n=1 Tax=Fusarium sarcochroum TaxID=1208366 RepID=A0A8H4TAS6_9HYPO|nr:hypothetical protein FSARC_12144 [Fusarium sarcochroum]
MCFGSSKSAPTPQPRRVPKKTEPKPKAGSSKSKTKPQARRGPTKAELNAKAEAHRNRVSWANNPTPEMKREKGKAIQAELRKLKAEAIKRGEW